MKHDQMFATKSRLQVAICLEKLLDALDKTIGVILPGYGVMTPDEFNHLLALYHLLDTRLDGLIRPIVWMSNSGYHHQRVAQYDIYSQQCVHTVRGWRRRWPDLLKSAGKEK